MCVEAYKGGTRGQQSILSGPDEILLWLGDLRIKTAELPLLLTSFSVNGYGSFPNPGQNYLPRL
jgi:hypothetical protein